MYSKNYVLVTPAKTKKLRRNLRSFFINDVLTFYQKLDGQITLPCLRKR
jgi:hypothetical protein